MWKIVDVTEITDFQAGFFRDRSRSIFRMKTEVHVFYPFHLQLLTRLFVNEMIVQTIRLLFNLFDLSPCQSS